MPATRKRGPGRPPLGAEARRSQTIRARVTPAVAARVREARKRLQQTESEWAAAAVDLALTRGDGARVRELRARVAELETELAEARARVQAITDLVASTR